MSSPVARIAAVLILASSEGVTWAGVDTHSRRCAVAGLASMLILAAVPLGCALGVVIIVAALHFERVSATLAQSMEIEPGHRRPRS